SSQATATPRLIEMPLTNTTTQIHIGRTVTDAPPSTPDNSIGISTIGTGNGTIPGGDPFSHTANSAAHVVKPTSTITVSRGVAEGMIVQRIVPDYPAIARAARLEGTVVLQATISKTGTIENLRVIDGPVMLRQAAINAVQQWRYRPYLLNGDPVEVETAINVNFTLGR
ncbi:MAG TPA: energy transducer TonB, partial [Terracidiphilus sp.]